MFFFEHSICSIFFGQMRRTTFQILGECALALLRDWDITVARTFLQNAGFSHTPSFFILLLRLLQFLRNCPRICTCDKCRRAGPARIKIKSHIGNKNKAITHRICRRNALRPSILALVLSTSHSSSSIKST